MYAWAKLEKGGRGKWSGEEIALVSVYASSPTAAAAVVSAMALYSQKGEEEEEEKGDL